MLASSIKEMLRKLPPVAEECSIYRVPRRLRNTCYIAYTPQAIAIGPFHHGKKDLMVTEELKLRCLDSYLRRIKVSVEDAVENARSWEDKARRFYAETIHMNSDDFVRMMLVDGCFIVELMIICYGGFFDIQHGLDPSFFKAVRIDLYRDLTMLENQLPFFVLQALFNMFPFDDGNKNGVSFIQLTHKFFSIGLIKDYDLLHDVSTEKISHLVDFLRFYYVPSPISEQHVATKGRGKFEREFLLPPTVSELCEAGVIVKRATKGKRLMDISFKDGVLEIPHFEVHDSFETYIRNLIAFEHYPVRDDEGYVIHYVEFLDGLISSEKDASLLVKAKIITNHIGGNDEEISKLFNNLCKDTSIPTHFYYYATSKALHEHCMTRRHRWMASLRRDYFNTPWASVSFIAAAFLILLTFLQTLCSFLSLL